MDASFVFRASWSTLPCSRNGRRKVNGLNATSCDARHIYIPRDAERILDLMDLLDKHDGVKYFQKSAEVDNWGVRECAMHSREPTCA